jgi:hypothetical protein
LTGHSEETGVNLLKMASVSLSANDLLKAALILSKLQKITQPSSINDALEKILNIDISDFVYSLSLNVHQILAKKQKEEVIDTLF